jgi:hypothetical protein
MAYFGKTNPKYFRYFKRLENQRYSRRLATWLIIDAQTMSVTRLDAHPAPLELDHPVHPCRPAPTQIHVNDAEQDLGKKRTPAMARQSGADATVVLKYLAAHFFPCLACKEAA